MTSAASLTIRQATLNDLDTLTDIEARCFPKAEAADRDCFAARLNAFASHFWIGEIDGVAVGFINGMVTDATTIDDEMYADASLHREDGKWQSIFGLDVLPEYRCRGYAACLMRALIEDACRAGRHGCILACKDHMIDYYRRFGYKLLGVSASQHGNAQWNDMILEF